MKEAETPGAAAEPIKILLIEDSPSDAVLLQESLCEAGPVRFEITHAMCWAEAAERLARDKCDVLLLDLTLPDVVGAETFLRARREAPHLPIVVLTGVEDEAVGLAAVRQGIQEYLIKGQAYGRQTARAILHAIERKRAETALRQAEAALERERDQLETRVQERTGELLAANRSLQSEIAQRRRAEAAHQEVQRLLSRAQETERGRISRELHDQMGQELTALKLGLQLLRKQGPFSASVQESIGKLEGLAEGLMRDIHRLAWQLRPSSLDDLGLELALRRYATEWSESTGVELDFDSRGIEGPRMPPDCETALYRIAQEALTNVTRHAKARHVSVLLERRAELASLIIEDDGQGFDADAMLQAAPTQGSLGLLGMEERIKLVGGTLEIESAPGAGATVFVRLPLTGK
jgi:signal transduction histidine kinase